MRRWDAESGKNVGESLRKHQRVGFVWVSEDWKLVFRGPGTKQCGGKMGRERRVSGSHCKGMKMG